MRRSLNWRRHPVLVAAAVAMTGLLVLEVGGAAAAALLALAVLLTASRLGWWPVLHPARTICVRVPLHFPYEHAFGGLFGCCAQRAELVGLHWGEACLELEYSVRLKRGRSAEGLLGGMQAVIDEGRLGS